MYFNIFVQNYVHLLYLSYFVFLIISDSVPMKLDPSTIDAKSDSEEVSLFLSI